MRRPTLRVFVALLLLALAVAVPVSAQDSARQQAQARRELAELRSKMQALAREQAQTAARRDSANAKLARQAEALAAAARALREADAALAAKQQQLEQLQQQRAELDQRLAGQRAAIADLLRATYTLGRGTDLRLLLGDQDLAQIARALAYSKYFQQDRAARVARLMDELSRLQQLEAQITAEQQALAATRAERADKAEALAAQRAAQQKLVAQANARYKDESQRLAAMKQNASSLDHLVDKLQRAIDEAAREAARSDRTSPAAPSRTGGKADIRGNLPWPADGAVVNYGNGVLIKATAGSEVHAVARGRVVYAAFLRGYGLLVILNHGDGWLSMYGNNETLLHSVGDQVEAGQPLGTASPTTGVNTGVYFELRHKNKPVDPRSWLAKRR
ncbi:murein hydrolase activator EnvC family protein [Frateuria hangzhouensis]|uniref:murein hydrolase activator EnvC family protein n=1 Tax=Frateuria hangzhouensis TaxID=2995589 RepID=UPI0022608A21|nr:peptidoglycan DD-metalloendopeptidase family protein [Frateuria sp. STR12]MCX7514532.1 peptidoglycan DD-metalloendopeptidase family protein [Frateuria sp. STR12]